MATENGFSAVDHRDSIQSASLNTIGDENWISKLETPQITLRATVVGLFIGSIVLISNFQFGLQTGWVSMMSLPSALLGYVLFAVSPWKQSFSDVENVYIQSIAVATGTGCRRDWNRQNHQVVSFPTHGMVVGNCSFWSVFRHSFEEAGGS